MPADLSDRGRQLALDEDAQSSAEAQRAFAQAQAIAGNDEVLDQVLAAIKGLEKLVNSEDLHQSITALRHAVKLCDSGLPALGLILFVSMNTLRKI